MREPTPARAGSRIVLLAIAVLGLTVGPLAIGPPPASASFIATTAGSPWRVGAGPDAGSGAGQLNGVSCSSSTTCVAVGSVASGGGSTQALIESLAGGSWTVAPNPVVAGGSVLYGVSCLSAVDCVAVGTRGTGEGVGELIETLNGSTWSIAPTPPLGSTGSTLEGVSCTQAAGVVRCDAVGYLGVPGRAQPLVMSSAGGLWQVTATPAVDSAYAILDAVSCSSAVTCTAVGYDEASGVTGALVETLAGTTWSVGTGAGREDGGSLSAVSCPSTSYCVAVGRVVPEAGVPRTLVESWNGASWASAVSPGPGSYGNLLAGVSCPTATDCVAAGSSSSGPGDRTLLSSWAGTTWSATPSPDPGTTADSLSAVSCVTIDSCQAVGTSATGREPDRTLALSFQVPPPVIAEVTFRGGSGRPRITITGSGFGNEPVGTPTGCGTTGTDYPGADLAFQDVQRGWAAGTPGNCLGLVVSHYTATTISYSFGSGYGTGNPPLELSASDAFTVSVDGATCSEIVPRPSSMSHRPTSGPGGPPVRATTLSVDPVEPAGPTVTGSVHLAAHGTSPSSTSCT